MKTLMRRVVLILGFALWGMPLSGSSAASPEMVVGVMAPLSGALSEYGQAVRNGIDLAGRDFPEIASNCRFDFRDSQYFQPESAVAHAHQLAAEGVRIIYNWGELTSSAVAPLADSLKVFMFAWTANPELSRQSSHLLRFQSSATDYAQTLANELRKAGYRRVGILHTDNAWNNLILAALEQVSSPDLTIIKVAKFAPPDTEFGAAVEKLKGLQLDVVGVFLVAGQISYAYRALNDQNVGLPTFGTDFLDSMLEVWKAGPAMDGAFFAANRVSDPFTEKYRRAFGGDTQISHSANGYEFARFLCRDLPRKKPGFTPEEIFTLVEGLHGEGALGPYRYVNTDGDRHINFPFFIRRIVGQSIVTDTE
jgi:ABC-type branched-subunit amino acid transport system substrate-binding protein